MTILKKISAYTAISVVTGGISFLILPVITKYLTPEDYGMLSIINALLRFLAALISLGITNVLLVNIIKHKPLFGKYFKSFLVLAIMVVVLLSLITSIIYLLREGIFNIPFIAGICLPLIAFFVMLNDTFSGIFVFFKDLKNYAVFSLSKSFIEVGGIFLFVVFLHYNWKGRILALFVSLLFAAFYGIRYLKKNRLLSGAASRGYANELLKNGLPLIFLNLAVMIMNLSDRFFIDYFVGIKQTGLYGMASTIAGILLIIIGASMNVFRPMLYEQLKQANATAHKKTTIKYIAIIFISTIALVGISPYIISRFIDKAYAASAQFTLPLLTGLFFWGIYNYYVSYFMFWNKNKIIGTLASAGIIVNLLLNYIFVTQYRAIGAAYATALTYLLLFLVSFIQVETHKKHAL